MAEPKTTKPTEEVAVADVNNDGEISTLEARLAAIDADLARLAREREEVYRQCVAVAEEKHSAPKENALTAYQRAQDAEFERKFAAAIGGK